MKNILNTKRKGAETTGIPNGWIMATFIMFFVMFYMFINRNFGGTNGIDLLAIWQYFDNDKLLLWSVVVYAIIGLSMTSIMLPSVVKFGSVGWESFLKNIAQSWGRMIGWLKNAFDSKSDVAQKSKQILIAIANGLFFFTFIGVSYYAGKVFFGGLSGMNVSPSAFFDSIKAVVYLGMLPIFYYYLSFMANVVEKYANLDDKSFDWTDTKSQAKIPAVFIGMVVVVLTTIYGINTINNFYNGEKGNLVEGVGNSIFNGTPSNGGTTPTLEDITQ